MAARTRRGGPTAVYLELGSKRVFACTLDWPGWCRSGKTEELALEALAAYADRYAEVAKEAGIAFPPGTGERLLTPHPFLLPRAVAPEGDDLRDRHENEQPGRRPERLADGRRRLVADKRRKPEERGVAEAEREPRRAPVAREHGDDEGHDRREEDGSARVVEERVDGRAHGRDPEQGPAGAVSRRAPRAPPRAAAERGRRSPRGPPGDVRSRACPRSRSRPPRRQR